jgi:hypothetical protein
MKEVLSWILVSAVYNVIFHLIVRRRREMIDEVTFQEFTMEKRLKAIAFQFVKLYERWSKTGKLLRREVKRLTICNIHLLILKRL